MDGGRGGVIGWVQGKARVGGWVEEACEEAYAINHHVLSDAHAFQGPNLWLYGNGDTVYSARHSHALFAAYRTAGGQGTYLQADLPWDGSGHMILSYPKIYHEEIAAFLDDL